MKRDGQIGDLVEKVQRKLALAPDRDDGLKTWSAIDAAIVLPPPKPLVTTDGTILEGDGKWPFTARINGDDIVVDDIVITCFGGFGEGELDPQDDGQTASGMNTARQKISGVSIAMDGRMFSSLKPPEHRALDGAPIPRLFNSHGLTAWHTPVEVTIDGLTYSPEDGFVDLGPGHQASRPGEPHALDLTPIAASHWSKSSLRQLARNFERRGSFKIIGGAKLIAP